MMMNIENLKKALSEAGIMSEVVEMVKNNVSCTGIRISRNDSLGKGAICPVIYYSAEESIKEFVERAKCILDSGLADINIDRALDPDYIRDNIFISVQRKSQQNAVKRPLLNLEIIMRLIIFKSGDGITSMVITPEFLETVGIDQDKLWEYAVRNMRPHFIVQSMAYYLGIPAEVDMYILSTENLLYGATALAYPELFEKFCYDTKSARVWILPSSTQELILLPDTTGITDPEAMALMVDDVNTTMVDPEIRLDPVVYVYELGSGHISIAGGVLSE